MSRSRVFSWGMFESKTNDRLLPKSREELIELVQAAAKNKHKIALRGGGNSYGDAALAQEGCQLLDLSALNQRCEFADQEGIVRVDPGVTIEQLWRFALPKGYWPAVVPGTMKVSVGGAAAMNIHGKNNFQAGSFGEHIIDFELLTMDGNIHHCSREKNAELFFAAIGGFGALGVFLSLTLKLKALPNTYLEVESKDVGSFAETFEYFEAKAEDSDYLVGWHDALASGKSLGRGLIHRACQGPELAAKSAAFAQISLNPLPKRFFGVFPRSMIWWGLWAFMHDWGMRLVNATKYHLGKNETRRSAIQQSHPGYHFLLDYVPNWKFAYKPGGLIQIQSFVPKAEAARVFEENIRLAQVAGLSPYLCVTKKHRPDPFLMTHAVDGYSQALDIRITKSRAERLKTLSREIEALVVAAGGRFYFAKDALMSPETLRQSYPQEALTTFRQLKEQHDPDSLLVSELYARLFS